MFHKKYMLCNPVLNLDFVDRKSSVTNKDKAFIVLEIVLQISIAVILSQIIVFILHYVETDSLSMQFFTYIFWTRISVVSKIKGWIP